MKIDVKGLKFKSWMYLMVFSLVILAVLWALQFLFLDRFYESMKLNEIKNMGDKITQRFDDSDFQTVLNEYAFKSNLRIVILNESGSVTWAFDGFPSDIPGQLQFGTFSRPSQVFLNTALKKLVESNANKTYFLEKNTRLDMTQSIYISKIEVQNGTPLYLYISSPIPSIDSTISVLKTQFLIITVILFILALIMALWISKKMSAPITRLTKSADSLVKGKLEPTFYEDAFTEISQLAGALNYASDELRSLDHYRKEILANVSHDLKTPLTIIKFYGELIKDVSGDHPEKREEHLDLIIQEADVLSEMVEEILELSKLEGDSSKVNKSIFNLSQSLFAVLESLKMLFEKEGYVFENDIEDDIYVYANKIMLRRVLYNLIGNALNFTGDDKLIRISLKLCGNLVRFEVSDTGQGIPAEKQDIIWDRYYKSEKSPKRSVVGTGLGLPIVKDILIFHMAEHGLISTQGQGSTFWFELPKS